MSVVDTNQIDDYSFSLRPNTSQWSAQADGRGGYQLVYKPSSFGGLCQNRLDTADGGPFRALQLGDRICTLISHIGFEGGFKTAAKIFNGGWTATIIPRLPGAFQSAKDAVSDLMTTKTIPGYFRRKCVSAVQEVSTFVSAMGYAAAPFLNLSEKTSKLGSSALKTAEWTTLAADVCDLQKSSEDLVKSGKLAKRAAALNAAPELVDTLKQTSRYQLLKTLKAITSVSGFVLGASLAAAGISKLRSSMIIASTVSLIGTMIATGAGLYKEGMKYKPVDFFDAKQVQYIAKTV